MVIITLTDCPPKVRGDLSKWLFEINTGVFVGNISTRVREELWQRICDNIKNGRVTMVYGAPNEQRFDFRVHNTSWYPKDFDGIKLMQRPLPGSHSQTADSEPKSGFSNAAKMQLAHKAAASRSRTGAAEKYVVVDIETTGIDPSKDRIIELAALLVNDRVPAESFTTLISIDRHIPVSITELTGITDEMLEKSGVPLESALSDFMEFISDNHIICHNSVFDFSFINNALNRLGRAALDNSYQDTLILARKKLRRSPDYKLTTLARNFDIDTANAHRALNDCYITHELYQKLNLKVD